MKQQSLTSVSSSSLQSHTKNAERTLKRRTAEDDSGASGEAAKGREEKGNAREEEVQLKGGGRA